MEEMVQFLDNHLFKNKLVKKTDTMRVNIETIRKAEKANSKVENFNI
jgi:hypothetical protein